MGIRLDIMPKRYLTLSYDLDMDLTSGGQGQAQNLYMTLDSGKGQIIRLDYQQIPYLDINEISVMALLKTYKDFYINTYHDYSLVGGGLMFTQGYGIKYVSGCWGLGVGYEKEGEDNRYIVSVDLLGLGGVGAPGFFGRTLFGEPRADYQHPETWVLAR